MLHNKYNSARYNTKRYNVEDKLVFASETVSASDAIVKSISKPVVEAVNSVDTTTRDFTNKRLSETVKLNDWLSIKRTNPSDWGDNA